MTDFTRSALTAIFLAVFGLFLIWKGVTGDVIRTRDGQTIFPAWVYILSGVAVLILPTAFLIVLLLID